MRVDGSLRGEVEWIIRVARRQECAHLVLKIEF